MIFKHLLVPTDFSDPAAHALRLAVRMSRQQAARITLLHVGRLPQAAMFDFPAYGMPLPDALGDLQRQLAEERTHVLERLGKDEIPQDVPWDTRLREGYAPEEILSEMGTGKYDLVVMGTHGHTGLKHVMLGSVTERVLRAAATPVLVTR